MVLYTGSICDHERNRKYRSDHDIPIVRPVLVVCVLKNL